MAAASYGHRRVAELLLSRGAKVATKSGSGKSALHIAASHGHISVARLLTKSSEGLRALNDPDQSQSAPLHYAAAGENLAMVKHLVHLRANVRLADRNGLLPVHCAVERGFNKVNSLPEIVEFLLDQGSGRGTARGKHQPIERILAQAAARGYATVVDNLLRRGKPYTLKVPGIMDSASWPEPGISLLESAAHWGEAKVVQVLLSHGMDIHKRSKSSQWRGFLPIHWAAREGHGAVVDVLLSKRAEVAALGPGGATAAHYAALQGHATLVERFAALKGGKALMKIEDDDGMRPKAVLKQAMRQRRGY